jgi:hypothetical protein
MAARQSGSSILHRQRSKEAFATRRKAWQVPALVRLEAGSAESGSATEEDGDFTAS